MQKRGRGPGSHQEHAQVQQDGVMCHDPGAGRTTDIFFHTTVTMSAGGGRSWSSLAPEEEEPRALSKVGSSPK